MDPSAVMCEMLGRRCADVCPWVVEFGAKYNEDGPVMRRHRFIHVLVYGSTAPFIAEGMTQVHASVVEMFASYRYAHPAPRT